MVRGPASGVIVAPAADGMSAVLTADVVGNYTVTVAADADLGAVSSHSRGPSM
jgi:hypothetical protein